MILSKPLKTPEEKYGDLQLNNSSEKTYRDFIFELIDEFKKTGDFEIFPLINKIIEENISENIRDIFENVVPVVINISHYKNIELDFYPSPNEMKSLMRKFERFKSTLVKSDVDIRTEINTLYLFLKAAFEALEEKYENKQDMLLFYQATVLSLLSWSSIDNLLKPHPITIQSIANHRDLSLLIIRFTNQFKPNEYQLYTLGQPLHNLNEFFKALRKANPYPYNQKKNNAESRFPFNRILEDFIFINYEACQEKLTEKILENGTTKKRIEKKRALIPNEELSREMTNTEQRSLKRASNKWEDFPRNSGELDDEFRNSYSNAITCTTFSHVKNIKIRTRSTNSRGCRI